jgi:hypothetical protein
LSWGRGTYRLKVCADDLGHEISPLAKYPPGYAMTYLFERLFQRTGKLDVPVAGEVDEDLRCIEDNVTCRVTFASQLRLADRDSTDQNRRAWQVVLRNGAAVEEAIDLCLQVKSGTFSLQLRLPSNAN